MRYTREEIKRMSAQEYLQTMCDELKNAGFYDEYNGEQIDYEPFEAVFGGAVVKNKEAIQYLKDIGIFNNGKCPMCSVREDDILYVLGHQNGSEYHVCKKCYKAYAYQERQKRGCFCCLFSIFIIAILI